MEKQLRKAAVVLLGASALSPAMVAAQGPATPGTSPEIAAASIDQQCRMVTVKKRVGRWVWVVQTRKVQGHRVVVRVHGRIVYVRARAWRTKTMAQLACSPTMPAAPAVGLLSAPAAFTPAPVAPIEPTVPSPQPPLNMLPPTISGGSREGQVLTAATGIWKGVATSFSYQWLRCDTAGGSCAPIAGAASSNYGLVERDVAHTLRVTVIAANAAGSSAAGSAPSAVVTPAERPPAGTSPPAIGGIARQAQTLSAGTGAWTGSPSAFSYEWLRCDSAGANCKPIGLATTATYNVAEADVGSTLRVAVTASNAAGASQAARSTQTAVVSAPAQPPHNISPPAIGGVARQGQTLSTSAGNWTGSPAAFSYEWLRCDPTGANCVTIASATASTYTVAHSDVGSALRVAVTATNAAGTSAPATSASSEVVAAAEQPPTSTSPPAISGIAQHGNTLSASPGSWTGSPTAFGYEWLRCDSAGANCKPIGLATTATYNVAEADVGSTLRVAVTASNAAGTSAPATSASSEVVTPSQHPPTNTSPPAISGVAREGQTLSATAGGWTNNPSAFSYEWLRCDSAGGNCVTIASTTASTYTVAQPDVGGTLRVAVTASNAAGASAPATSGSSEVVAAAEQPPTSTSPPAISGVAQEAKALSAAAGSWTGSPTAFSYEWLRCDSAGARCVTIASATSSSYIATEADVGSTLRVAVTASNATGPSAPARSSQTSVVIAAEHAPANTSPPTISGVAQEGKTLSASEGGWTNNPTAFAHEWLRCDSAGANCKPMGLATTASYNVTEADVGSTLRVAVTASNAAGPSAPARSAQTSVVIAAEHPPTNTSPPAISGVAQEGKTLSATAGGWTNNPSAFSYEWLRCDSTGASCTPIVSATTSSYKVAEVDVGKTLRVAVTASNAAGSSAPAASAPSEVVTAAEHPPTNTSPPTISGVSREGKTLSATAGGWTNNPTAFAHQWLRCDSTGANCVTIASATAPTYTVAQPDVGSTLRVAVTATNVAGTSAPATSASSEVVAAAEHPPTNTSPPTISGVSQEGKTLSASAGGWTNNPTAFAYQWLRCDSTGANCVTIASATASSYKVAEADVGKTLRVAVTASNAAGPSAPATSAQTAVVTAPESVHHLEYVLQVGTVSVYDIDHQFERIKTISLPQTKDQVRGVTVAPAGHTMYVIHGGDGPINSSGNGSVLAYDLVSEKVMWDVKLGTGVDSGQVSPDGSKLYVPTGENTSTGIWNVLSAATGEVISTIQGGSLAHNTVASNDGRYVYLGGRGYNFLDVYETATGRVKELGPLIGSVRPFTANGSNTLAFTTATGFDGFQISSVTTGKVLYTVSFGELPKGFPFSTASHGIALSPDEREVYAIDAVHKAVQVWDVSKVKEGVAPAQLGVTAVEGLSGNESPCVYDCGRGGWLQLSRDGRHLFVGDSGEVIDTSTRKAVTTLSTLAQTKFSIEVDWQGGVPIATSGRTGVGYVP